MQNSKSGETQEHLNSANMTYLSSEQVEIISALVDVLMPGEAGVASASEVGVVNYIDRVLSTPNGGLGDQYLQGLHALNRYCSTTSSTRFTALAPSERHQVVEEILGPPSITDGEPSSAHGPRHLKTFLELVLMHTIEGYFGDPAYGGNRGQASWRLIGFPGAQWGYSEDQMKEGFDSRTIPIKTLKDLRERAIKDR